MFVIPRKRISQIFFIYSILSFVEFTIDYWVIVNSSSSMVFRGLNLSQLSKASSVFPNQIIFSSVIILKTIFILIDYLPSVLIIITLIQMIVSKKWQLRNRIFALLKIIALQFLIGVLCGFILSFFMMVKNSLNKDHSENQLQQVIEAESESDEEDE